jgi:hypothetical protein
MDTAPPPFTADDIRRATKVGRRYVFRMVDEGRVAIRTLEFIAVGPDRVTTRGQNFDESGAPLDAPHDAVASFADLVKHATYPKEGTTIERSKMTVPAGEIDCIRYTIDQVRDGLRTVSRVYFAADLPGPPIGMTVEVDGKIAMTLELLEHTCPP